MLIGELDRRGFVVNTYERGKLARARFERSNQKTVLDVVAEHVQPDLPCVKTNLGRPQQSVRIVNDPHHPQGRGVLAATLPDAERFERLGRALKQGAGA